MKKIFLSGRLKKILAKNKKQLESQLNINIEVEGKHILVSSKKDALLEYLAEKVFKALGMGFDFDIALSLTNQNFMFEIIDIKQTKEKRFKEAAGRIIGKGGKTIKMLSRVTGCEIVVRDNIIGIIGESAAVTLVVHALNSLIRGAPHSHVFKFLQENKGKMYESEEI